MKRTGHWFGYRYEETDPKVEVQVDRDCDFSELVSGFRMYAKACGYIDETIIKFLGEEEER